MTAAFAILGYEYAEMSLVRSFILAESQIPVETVGAILEGEAPHFGVETLYTLQKFGGEIIENCLCLFITRLVGIKPGFIVIRNNIRKK